MDKAAAFRCSRIDIVEVRKTVSECRTAMHGDGGLFVSVRGTIDGTGTGKVEGNADRNAAAPIRTSV